MAKKSRKKKHSDHFKNWKWKFHWPAALFITLLATFIYGRGITYDYVLDDKIVITDNAFTAQGIEGIPEIFTTETFTGFFKEQKDLLEGGRYRPLSIATFAVEKELAGGFKPLYSHIINILLYILTGWILYRYSYIIRPNLFKKWFWSVGLLGALIFITHPVHTEVIANIKGRDEILALLFSLLGLTQAHRYFRSGKWIYLAFLSLTLFFGLLAKETAITFLAVIPLSLWCFERTGRGKWKWTFSAVILPTLIYFLLRSNAIGYMISPGNGEITDLMNNPFYGMDLIEKWAHLLYIQWKYIQLLFFPYALSHDYYPYAFGRVSFGSWQVWAAIITILAALIYVLRNWKSPNGYVFNILYYFLTLSIASNIIIGVGTFMNERFLYMPSVGFALGLSLLIFHIAYQKRITEKVKPFIIGTGLILILLYAMRSYVRVPVWQSEYELNKAAIKTSPTSARARLFMGTALFKRYQNTEDPELREKLLKISEQQFDKAEEILQEYGNRKSRRYRYYNLYQMRSGIAVEKYNRHRDINQLLSDFRNILEEKHNVGYVLEYFKYLLGRQANEQMLKDWAIDVAYNELYKNQGRSQTAATYLAAVVEHDPNNARALLALGLILKDIGHESSSDYIRKARSIDPTVVMD